MGRLFVLAAMAAICPAVAPAQDISGTISGFVMDSTGGAVTGAKLVVSDETRNQEVRTVVTGVDGGYSAPLLPVSSYSLKAEASGFRTYVQEGIRLNANDQLRINITLELGAITEQITVQADPVTVELGTVTAANVISGTQVRELSISTRNYQSLVALMPGVTANQTDQLYVGNSLPSGLANIIPFSINGQRSSANNWTVDGADNVDRGSNLSLLNYPSIDAIEEFKVLRSLYTADAGRAGGGQINVVTKSGTSDFHGSLYEFVRNDAFAANNSLNNMRGVNVGSDGKAKTPPLRYNDFGYTIGGPIFIPGRYNKDKNKTFFFWSQEFNRVITYTSFTATVPTPSEKQGIFASPVCVATQGSACTETATRIANIDPIARQYLTSIYARIPDATGGNTLVTSGRNVFNRTQELLRLDHSFSETFSIWGRLLIDRIPTVEPGGIFTGSPIPGLATTESESPGTSLALHAVNTLRPNLLNEAAFNYSHGAFRSEPMGLAAKTRSPELNPPLPFPNTLGVVPSLNFSDVGSPVIGVGPYDNRSNNYNTYDSLSWIRGRHTLKFGVTANWYQKVENSPNGNNYGTFRFSTTPRPAGTSAFQQAWANFLLGNVGTFTQASKDLAPDVRGWQWEGFAQDDFRATANLTVYAGVRYSFFGQPVDADRQLTNFDRARYNPADAPQIDSATGNIIPGTGNPLPGMPAGSQVWTGLIVSGVNSPFGARVSNNGYRNFGPRVGLAWDVAGDGKTSVRTGYGIYHDSPLFGIFLQNVFTNPPFVRSVNISNTTLRDPSGGTASVSLAPPVLRGTPLPNMTPYVQHWSFDIQRRIGSSLLLDVGYYGSKGTHLLGVIDINQAPPGAAYAAGLHSGPGTIFTTADTPRINAVRPFRGYNAINTVQPWFNSNYHSLQAQTTVHFGEPGQIQASYTWSKALTDNASDRSNAPQNTYNFRKGEYGPATLDRRHVLTINYIYEFPIFKNRKGALAYALKGWQISGIISFATGLPTTATTTGVDPAGLGFLGSSAAAGRPDLICDPNKNAPHTVAKWFRTECFADVPSGEIRPGNEGRFVIRLPGYQRWDISLFKNIPLTERFRLQLRGESFNALNHPNPSAFGSLVRSSSLFGTISGFRDPRIIQLAAKLYF